MKKKVPAKPGICPGKWDAQTPLGFWNLNGSPNLSQTIIPSHSQPKKTLHRKVDFAVPADHRIKLKESEKRDKYQELVRELKKLEHESDDDTNFNWCSQYSHQRIDTRTGRLGNKKTSGDHPNNSIFEVGENTAKSPGDLRKLAVTQSSVENHQLTLAWKTLKWVK